MSKKNTGINVDIMRILVTLKDYKMHVWFLILLLLTIRFKCGWDNRPIIGLECNPLSIHDVKDLVGGK